MAGPDRYQWTAAYGILSWKNVEGRTFQNSDRRLIPTRELALWSPKNKLNFWLNSTHSGLRLRRSRWNASCRRKAAWIVATGPPHRPRRSAALSTGPLRPSSSTKPMKCWTWALSMTSTLSWPLRPTRQHARLCSSLRLPCRNRSNSWSAETFLYDPLLLIRSEDQRSHDGPHRTVLHQYHRTSEIRHPLPSLRLRN